MYLKSLELAGFKSFGSRSVLEFNKGLVAVVGPNGSGKSNVADAIRWVLGEQSTRALRLNKSEELIFAGTDKKPMASMAEVSLLLDNAQRKMPVDAPEVEITRRLYRNGESEYRLNGGKIRLHELQDLLAKAGFGQNSYAVIGQGMVEKLLLTSPVERKVLFEEASGTKQFELRRDRHLKSLQQTNNNIADLEALINDLEPKHAAVARDAQALAARHELEAQIRQGKQYVAYEEILHKRKLATTTEQGAQGYEIELKELEDQLNLLQAERDARTKKESELQRRRRLALITHTRLSAKRSILVEKLAVLQAERSVQDSLASTDNKRDKLGIERELASVVKSISVAQKKVDKVGEDVAAYDKKIEHIEAALKELNSRLASHRRHLQRGQKREYLNHALGLLSMLAHNDNIVTMKKADRELAIHKMRRMIKLAIEDQSELIAQEISSLQVKVTRQMTKREELVEQRNKEIIRLRGLELDISSYQDGKIELEAQLEMIRNEDQKAARASVADKTEYDKKEAVLRKDLQELDAQLVEAQSVMGAEVDSAAGQVSRQDRVIERLVSKKSEVSVLLKGSNRQLGGYRKELERMEKDYHLSYGSLDGPKADYGAVSVAGVAQLEARLSMTQQLDANSVTLASEIGDRLAKLRVQRDDLVTASKDLEKLISQLDKDIQSRFATSFKAINTQFGHFFHKLFGGGTGKLVYEARDDGEYGIEITAMPPGKHTQQLAMLSGGERSLGAIALLAAIMAVNPSPFVVLDEVDAALDDANSQKFNQVLQELIEKTQLIVITHNHETMQAAQQLIGITSDAQGVAMAVSAQLSPTGSI